LTGKLPADAGISANNARSTKNTSAVTTAM